MDYTNRQVGHFRLKVLIARGGFGEVWKGHEVGDRKDVVALKIMRKDMAKDRSNRQLFEKEWKLVKDFDHPGLLSYREFGVHENLPYMAMEYFNGRSLKGLIGESKGMVRGSAMDIITSIAASLEYLHLRGVVHRDLKPENVLVDEAASTRLIDFSISQTRWQRILSFGGKIVGTPTYLAPEQLSGKRASAKSDIYSFGAIIFEMLAGRPPFVGDSEQQVMQQHMNAKPPRLSSINRDISTGLDKLIATMLAKDPEVRPASAGEIARRIGKTAIYVDS